MQRGNSPIANISSAISSDNCLQKLCANPKRASEWAAVYLKNYWVRDSSRNYPGLPELKSNQTLITQDWDRISEIILQPHSSRKQCEFDVLLVVFSNNEPMIGDNPLASFMKKCEENIDFNHDMMVIKSELNQLKIRQDLQEIQNSNIYQGLGVWMDLHAKGNSSFSDPFCVTSVFIFLESGNPEVDIDLFWKYMQTHERRRRYHCMKSFRSYSKSK
jgi:hypothetical protein